MASLGDDQEITELIKGLKKNTETERLRSLEAIARTGNMKYLPLLLTYFGVNPSIDDRLRPLFLRFPSIYSIVLGEK